MVAVVAAPAPAVFPPVVRSLSRLLWWGCSVLLVVHVVDACIVPM